MKYVNKTVITTDSTSGGDRVGGYYAMRRWQ